jgi:hypothetical protein
VNSTNGKVYVTEGQHRLNAVALEGKTVPESVQGADGWLEYTYEGETDMTGEPPAWNSGAPNQSNPDNPWEGQEGY